VILLAFRGNTEQNWAVARQEVNSGSDFQGVSEARVDFVAGVPRLLINGQPTPPIFFFFNTDVPGEKSELYLQEQVRLSAQAGIHLYSLPLRCPRSNEGRDPNYAWGEGLLDRFIRVDPEAVFLLRVYPGPWPFWAEWSDIPPEHLARFADGTTGNISLASDYFWEPSNADLAKMIRHFEASPYGRRILGWHPGGPEHEMFWDRYREKGPDYSEVNQQRFREWLRAKYQTDEALRRAWGQPDVTLDSAGIPTFEPGRFPMHGVRGGQTVQVFYDLPREQDWIDFSAYCSDVVADRILDWAQLVKRETQGRKLTAFFYGYTWELPGSFSGHYALRRVLACPAVDILAAPCSYLDRRIGGAGNFMSLVDTVTAHGKLWINEDDTRTYLWGPLNEEPFNQAIAAKDLPETINVLERNFASILGHRAGTWWMDLAATGAFNHPALWERLKERRGLYDELYQRPQPYRPEVAILVDERSKLTIKSDWDVNCWTMYQLRDESVKSGASVGFYSLEDFLDNIVPQCQVYVFANAFYLTDEQIQALRSRLDREEATAIWFYAPGYLGPAGPDITRASRLTGLQLAVQEGTPPSPPLHKGGSQGSEGLGLLQGEAWGPALALSPRLTVTDETAEPLGRYKSDGQISAAQTQAGQHRSIFIGDMGPSSRLLARLFESAGVHLWTRGAEVVQTDGEFLVVHSGAAGVKPIFLPAGVEAKPLQAKVVKQAGPTLFVEFQEGETVWFRLLGRN
jgi:hypothetical protein